MQLTKKICTSFLLSTVLTLMTSPSAATVNLLTGAFEQEWRDEIGGSKAKPQIVKRSYSSREGWVFETENLPEYKLKRDENGQLLQAGRWKYSYKDDQLQSVSKTNDLEKYHYDENNNLVLIESTKKQTELFYDSNKDRILRIKNDCILNVSYLEKIQNARYHLTTSMQTKCPKQKMLQRQYRFQFSPSNEGWQLEQAWENTLSGG
jgi:hypothetical protein